MPAAGGAPYVQTPSWTGLNGLNTKAHVFQPTFPQPDLPQAQVLQAQMQMGQQNVLNIPAERKPPALDMGLVDKFRSPGQTPERVIGNTGGTPLEADLAAMSQAATRPGTSPTPYGNNGADHLLPGGMLDADEEDSWSAFAKQTNHGKNIGCASSAFVATLDNSMFAGFNAVLAAGAFLSPLDEVAPPEPFGGVNPNAISNMALPALPSTPGSFLAPPPGISGVWDEASLPRLGSGALGGAPLSANSASLSRQAYLRGMIGSGAFSTVGGGANLSPFSDVPAAPLLSPLASLRPCFGGPQAGCAPSPLAGPMRAGTPSVADMSVSHGYVS